MSIDQPRHLQSVSNDQWVLILQCGHRVRCNQDIFDYVPQHHHVLIKCAQCDRDNLEIDTVINAGDIKPAFSPVVEIKDLSDELLDVYGGLPFILHHSLVYVPYQQPPNY